MQCAAQARATVHMAEELAELTAAYDKLSEAYEGLPELKRSREECRAYRREAIRSAQVRAYDDRAQC